jgi:c-di-GMP-related signal transduction protein
MQNVSFLVLARPIVDSNNQTKYLKIKVVKRIGDNEEQPLQKGAILHFLTTNFEVISKHLKENQRIIFDLPLDFLVSKSLLEEIDLKKVAIVTTEPVGKVTSKHIFEIKNLVKIYIQNGVELAIKCSIFPRYGLKIGKDIFKFICTEPQQICRFSPLCFENVDTEEIFQKVKEKGILFCGKLFGDYQVLEEITALSYLQNTIEKALELLNDTNINASEIEQVIKTDPKLSIAILKYANSPVIAPLTEIKELRHAIVYLGFNRLKDFLITFLINQLATVDKNLYEFALQLAAAGFLMEKYGASEDDYSKCELFLAGVIYEFSKVTGKPPRAVYEMISPPRGCERIITDPKLRQIYKSIKEEEKLRMKESLKKVFG